MAIMLEPTARQEIARLVEQSKARRIRTMLRFAQEEIIIPEGPFQGTRFDPNRQPYSKLWFDAVDSGLWRRRVATGPSQTGKTLTCFAIPILYHLFEMRENVVCGVPNEDLVADQWKESILPVIEASQYRDLIPGRLRDSEAKRVPLAIRMRNGATLRFMTAGGSDKSRASFTARVLAVTETDGMDKSSSTSREADKISQLEARLRAWGSAGIEYLECTVSIEEGRTWREYKGGTESRIAMRCPHCRQYVTLGRDDLRGWQDADGEGGVKKNARYVCNQCEKPWTEHQRRDAANRSVLVHRGQSVNKSGRVVGIAPDTETLGFRWSAPDNLFLTAGDVAMDEWRGQRDPDEDNAEKQLCQFVWAIPTKDKKIQITPLDPTGISRRTVNVGRGFVLPECELITTGIDLGKWLCHWFVLAWRQCGGPHLVDYGRIEVPSEQGSVEDALMNALRQWRDMVNEGWPRSETGEVVHSSANWVDSGGTWTEAVYDFIKECDGSWKATKGFGYSQDMARAYANPKKRTNTIRFIGDDYHVSQLKDKGILLVEINADRWKSFLHERLSTPVDKPSAFTLFRAETNEHLAVAKHLTAERQVEEFVAGKGRIIKWQKVNRNNHWLDAGYLACTAGHFAGVRVLKTDVAMKQAAAPAGGGYRKRASGGARTWAGR